MSQLFLKKIKKARDTSPTGRALSAVQSLINDQKAEMRSVGEFIGMESLNETQVSELGQAVENWTQSFQRIASDLGMENFQISQAEAATAALAGLSNVEAFLRTPVTVTGTGNANTTFVGMEGLEDGLGTRMPAFEAYDEKDNRNAVAYSVAYNLVAGRQNEFGEAFFPTVTVTNDNVGVQVSIRLIQVYNDFKRETGAALASYQKRNIVKAMIDNKILKNEMTRIFPVFRTGVNADKFVDATYMAPYSVINEGESILTAPLKPGARYDLLALSQTDALIANGLMDPTDSIDPAVDLEAIYISVSDGTNTDKIRLNVGGLAGANFVYSPQDLHRLVRMNFVTTGVILNKTTQTTAKADPVALADIKTLDLIVYLRVGMFGEINTEQGDTYVQALEIGIDRIVNPVTGLQVPLTDASVADIVAAFATAKIEGYDLRAYRTNLNRRQRGQLLDVTYYNQIWAVPLRSPITALRPVNADAQSDNSDLSALVAATFVRTSNEAVRTLVQTADMLKAHVDNRVNRTDSEYDHSPALFGVARFLIEPTFFEETLNVATAINSVQSHEKARDVAAVLVMKIRDVAARLYRDSGFQAVVDTQAAGVEGNPTVIVGTDPMTARYLMIDGEGRMAGPEFQYRVVTTPDLEMENKLYIALGYPEKSAGQLNPLHFGNMLWSPELVLTLPIGRGGQVSKELTVQPRFRHIVNVPVLARVTVSNLPSAAVNHSILVTAP